MENALENFVNTVGARGPHHILVGTRAEALALAKAINSTLNTCSQRLVQQTSSAIVVVVVPSAERRAALANYMTSLSEACKPRPAAHTTTRATKGTLELANLSRKGDKYLPPTPAYKRLHAVYIISNVLLALKADSPQNPLNNADGDAILDDLTDLASRLFQLAACRGDFADDNVSAKLIKLVNIWRQHSGMFPPSQLDSLEAMANDANNRDLATVIQQLADQDVQKIIDARKAQAESKKWIFPRQHGFKDDLSAPWWELPAANGLFMRRTRGYPLRAAAFPDGGYPLHKPGQEADAKLQKEVLALRDELFSCFDTGSKADAVQDIDPLGNIIYKDPDRPTRNFWGFSYDGISKIKEIEKKAKKTAIGYSNVGPLRPDRNPYRKHGFDVQRARELAGGGYGGRGNWRGRGDRGGYRGRGNHRGGQ